ncbi:unnamed protein product [Prunus brigantina]
MFSFSYFFPPQRTNYIQPFVKIYKNKNLYHYISFFSTRNFTFLSEQRHMPNAISDVYSTVSTPLIIWSLPL